MLYVGCGTVVVETGGGCAGYDVLGVQYLEQPVEAEMLHCGLFAAVDMQASHRVAVAGRTTAAVVAARAAGNVVGSYRAAAACAAEEEDQEEVPLEEDVPLLLQG